MCPHRQHRTGNCRECEALAASKSRNLGNGILATVNSAEVAAFHQSTPDMPQVWTGDNS